MDTVKILKHCSNCKTHKLHIEFHKNKAQPDGYMNICKICSKSIKQAARKERTAEKIAKDRAYKKAYVALNKDAVRAQGRKDKKKAYRIRVDFLNEIKERAGGCERCGYNKCKSALHFHHVNPKDKSFSIRDPKARVISLEKLQKEVLKCILVCANCHAEIHENERNTRKTEINN